MRLLSLQKDAQLCILKVAVNGFLQRAFASLFAVFSLILEKLLLYMKEMQIDGYLGVCWLLQDKKSLDVATV